MGRAAGENAEADATRAAAARSALLYMVGMQVVGIMYSYMLGYRSKEKHEKAKEPSSRQKSRHHSQ